jgi:hypothetical protein
MGARQHRSTPDHGQAKRDDQEQLGQPPGGKREAWKVSGAICVNMIYVHILGMNGDFSPLSSVDFVDFLVTPTTLGVHIIPLLRDSILSDFIQLRFILLK